MLQEAKRRLSHKQGRQYHHNHNHHQDNDHLEPKNENHQVDQIFRGGNRGDSDPAALLRYEFASAPSKVGLEKVNWTDFYLGNQEILEVCNLVLG